MALQSRRVELAPLPSIDPEAVCSVLDALAGDRQLEPPDGMTVIDMQSPRTWRDVHEDFLAASNKGHRVLVH